MTILMHVCRVLLGIIFLCAGLNGYFVIFGFDPFIATSPEAMALFEFKYLLVIEKTLECICGIFLLINQYIPLIIAILTPLVANIFLLHLFLDHSLLPLAVMLVLMNAYVLFYYRKSFMGLIERKPTSL